MDQQLDGLLMKVLNLSEDQINCINTEMSDVASRCRLLKTSSHAIAAEPSWRESVALLANIVSNQLGPERNRIVHDQWYEASSKRFIRLDRRAKIRKAKSFASSELFTSIEADISVDSVDLLAIKAIGAATRFAEAGFDVAELNETGHFPKPYALSHERIKKIPEFELLPEDEEPARPPRS